MGRGLGTVASEGPFQPKLLHNLQHESCLVVLQVTEKQAPESRLILLTALHVRRVAPLFECGNRTSDEVTDLTQVNSLTSSTAWISNL